MFKLVLQLGLLLLYSLAYQAWWTQETSGQKMLKHCELHHDPQKNWNWTLWGNKNDLTSNY